MNKRNARCLFALETWIAKATKDIIPSEQERLAAEFMEHYGAAYEEALDAGADSAAARDKAMGQLGKAWKVRHQLRKHYVTEQEMDWLQRECYPLSQVKGLRHFHLFWFFSFWMLLMPKGATLNTHDFIFVLLLALPAFIYSIVSKSRLKNLLKHNNARKIAKKVCINNALVLLLLLPAWFSITYPKIMIGSFWNVLLFFCIGFIFIYQPYAIYRKLGRDTLLKQ